MRNRYFFILGSGDPEMEAIAILLTQRNIPFTFAEKDGRRVNSRLAYEADPVECPRGSIVVFVECAVPGIIPGMVIDHHAEGDRGFNLPPASYWEASSIGQVCHLLGEPATVERRAIAAADHCLGAAYRGDCPGVNPIYLEELRVNGRSQWIRSTPEAVRADIQHAKDKIQTLPTLEILDHTFYDARKAGDIRELKEAAAQLGTPVIYARTLRSGDKKVGLLSASPAESEAWLIWARMRDLSGLTQVYGDPMRGIVGGYIREGGTHG